MTKLLKPGISKNEAIDGANNIKDKENSNVLPMIERKAVETTPLGLSDLPANRNNVVSIP